MNWHSIIIAVALVTAFATGAVWAYFKGHYRGWWEGYEDGFDSAEQLLSWDEFDIELSELVNGTELVITEHKPEPAEHPNAWAYHYNESGDSENGDSE